MDIEPVRVVVRRVRLRLARNLALAALCRSLFWIVSAFAIFLLFHRLFTPGFGLLWPALIGGAAVAFATGLSLASRLPSTLAAAAAADETFGLKTTLSSALLADGADSPMIDAFRLRAERTAREVKPQGAFGFRPPWEGKFLALPACAVAALFLFVPPQDLLGLLTRREETERKRENVRFAAEELKRRLKKLEEKKEEVSFEGARKIVRDMEKVAALLERRTADEKEALAQLSELEEKLKKRREEAPGAERDLFRPKKDVEASQNELTRKIEKSLKDGGDKKAARKLLDTLKNLEDKFKNEGMTAEEMEAMARELKQLVRNMDLPDALAAKLRKLAESLEKKASEGDGRDYKVPPPELDFTMEELRKMLEQMEQEEFIDEALRQIDETRQALIQKLKLCPYCKKGLKHPWEGGTPLPGMGPGGEPGVGYI